MGKYWYIVDVCATHAATGDNHPGTGGGSCMELFGGMSIYAYSPDPRVLISADGEDEIYAIPLTCLVGTVKNEYRRTGWTNLSLEEARAHFESVVGRPPSDLEVF